jgi:hypothetical protein
VGPDVGDSVDGELVTGLLLAGTVIGDPDGESVEVGLAVVKTGQLVGLLDGERELGLQDNGDPEVGDCDGALVGMPPVQRQMTSVPVLIGSASTEVTVGFTIKLNTILTHPVGQVLEPIEDELI